MITIQGLSKTVAREQPTTSCFVFRLYFDNLFTTNNQLVQNSTWLLETSVFLLNTAKLYLYILSSAKYLEKCLISIHFETVEIV